MDICMPRGDLRAISFTIMNPSGTVSSEEFDDIFFTVKKNTVDKKALIQKRLSDRSIAYIEEGTYQFVIEPEDTDELSYGAYWFDIELLIEGELKQTFVGKLILTEEVTFAVNEE